MKKLSVILLFTALVSCHKEKVSTSQEQLLGTWELRVHKFGYAGVETFPTGTNNCITFNNAGQYSASGLIAGSGSYEFSTWTNAWGMTGNLLKLKSLQQPNSTYDYQFDARIFNDTLRLDNSSTMPDSPTFFYIKK